MMVYVCSFIAVESSKYIAVKLIGTYNKGVGVLFATGLLT